MDLACVGWGPPPYQFAHLCLRCCSGQPKVISALSTLSNMSGNTTYRAMAAWDLWSTALHPGGECGGRRYVLTGG